MKNGKLGAPLKGATLIGTGPESMQRISMIGNDMQLDEGIGTCGNIGLGKACLSGSDNRLCVWKPG